MFDVRLQFGLLLLSGFLVMFIPLEGSIMLALIAIILLFFERYSRLAFKWCIYYGVLLFFYNIFLKYVDSSLFNLLLLMFVVSLKMLPTIIIASSLSQVPSGKLIASLQKIRVPEKLLITLTIAVRFFPILRAEMKLINENAVMRGVSLKKGRNWSHLGRMFEYAIIPILMRTLRLAEELSAAAMTRGMNAPCQKTSQYAIKFQLKDSIGMVLGLSMLGTLFLQH